jgi:MFS family permease
LILPLIFAVSATGIMGNSLLSPALPDVLDDLGVGRGGAGVLIAATSLPGIVVAPLIGVLADRVGRRAVLVPCLVVFGLSGIAVATAPTFVVMVAARFAMGFGAAGLVNLAVVLLGDRYEGEERTRWIGVNAGVLTLGLAVLPLVSGGLTSFLGWRWALAPYSLALVTAAAAQWILDGSRPPAPGSVRQQLGGLGDVLRRPDILAILGSGSLVFVLVFGPFLTTLPLHLDEVFDLDAGARGAFLALPALSSSVVAFNLGRLRRHLGLGPVLVGSGLLFVLAFVLLGAAPTLVVVALGCIAYGIAEGALIPALQDTALTRAPQAHRGAVVAVWVGAARLGQTVGPLAFAAVLGLTSTTVALSAGAAVSLVLVALLATGPLRRRPDTADASVG